VTTGPDQPSSQPDPGAPAQAVIAEAAEAEGIPVINLFGVPIPLTAPAGFAAWSLFDLIMTSLSVLLLIVVALRALFAGKKEKEADAAVFVRAPQAIQTTIYPRKTILVASAVITALALVLFFITQNMSLPLVLFDAWSIAFGAVVIISAATVALSVGKRVEKTGARQT
jgi:hypothetical protein